MLAGSMLKAAVNLMAGRSTAPETTKKIMEDFDKLMNSGDPTQATEILKPEVRTVVCGCLSCPPLVVRAAPHECGHATMATLYTTKKEVIGATFSKQNQVQNLCAIHDCGLGISAVTPYSGKGLSAIGQCGGEYGTTDVHTNSNGTAAPSRIVCVQKRARGRPRIRPPEEERKHRDLGSYNLFVMKAQNVAGPDVKNHRAFMGLIGMFWKVRTSHCCG